MVTRREFLRGSGIMAMSALGGGEGEGQGTSGKNRPPSVLIFFTDQQRWDTVGVYGSPMNLTPNLDALARKGTIFQAAITNQPLCAPTRACLWTGMYQTKHGVWRNAIGLSPEIPTIAHHFKKAGYIVGYIGKWHLSPLQVGRWLRPAGISWRLRRPLGGSKRFGAHIAPIRGRNLRC
jgi:arylsulfatase A-like enzyme